MSLADLERLLEVYSLEEILELNDVTSLDTLEFLLEQEFIELPDVKPL